jgi:hypothetical protein
MAQNKKCVLCDRTITEESPAILAVGAYGNPKCVCGECQSLLDTATLGREYDKIANAMDAIGKRMADSTPDNQSYEVVNALLTDAAERAKKIKAGEYDFSLDEEPAEDGEIPEELLETEEDRKLDEQDAEKEERNNRIFDYITFAVFLAALGFAAYKFIIPWIMEMFK